MSTCQACGLTKPSEHIAGSLCKPCKRSERPLRRDPYAKLLNDVALLRDKIGDIKERFYKWR